jgi:hypothetical protein
VRYKSGHKFCADWQFPHVNALFPLSHIFLTEINTIHMLHLYDKASQNYKLITKFRGPFLCINSTIRDDRWWKMCH